MFPASRAGALERLRQVGDYTGVQQVLMFYSDFLLPGLSKYDKRARVLHVMEVLHLIQLKNHFVGGPISFGVSVRGISGGQKRRLSIGYESGVAWHKYDVSHAWCDQVLSNQLVSRQGFGGLIARNLPH